MTQTPHVRIEQVNEDRREMLELLLVVLILGLFLNLGASAAYDLASNGGRGGWILGGSAVASFGALWVFVKRVLLRPIRYSYIIPVLLFYDTRRRTIAVPAEIPYPPHMPGHTRGPQGLLPFPIQARVDFDAFRKATGTDGEDPLNTDRWFRQLASLMESLLLELYAERHFGGWAPNHGVSAGPFGGGGWRYDLPKKEYSFAEVATLSDNKVIQAFRDNFEVIPLPSGSRIEFPHDQVVVFRGPSYCLSMAFSSMSSNPMAGWEVWLSSDTPWYRELSSAWEDTHYAVLGLEVTVVLRSGFWRLFDEDWLPKALRPRVKLNDICAWLNDWLDFLSEYFDWVDEDTSRLPDRFRARLIGEAPLQYLPRSGKWPVVFTRIPPVTGASSRSDLPKQED